MTGRAIRIERIARAQIERVFEAFVDPAHARQWWGPPDVATSIVEIDRRVGGVCRWVMHPAGVTRVLHGRIEALDPPRLLVMTNRWDDETTETRITLRLAPHPDGTHIVLIHEQLGPDADPAVFEAGWALALDSLDNFLTNTKDLP